MAKKKSTKKAKTAPKKKSGITTLKEFAKNLMKPIEPKERLTSGNKNTRKLLKKVK
jgi:hypothetical protein